MKIQELAAPVVSLQSELNPDLWDQHERLAPDYVTGLKRLADEFATDTGIGNVSDIVLTGSNTGFAYAPGSALVVHVIANVLDDDVYQELLAEQIATWNQTHAPVLNGYPVELAVAADPSHDWGSYSVLHESWVTVPRRRAANAHDAAVQSLTESWRRRLEAGHDQGWQQLCQSVATGSVEQLVVESVGHLADTIARVSLTHLAPEVKQRDFRWSYGEYKPWRYHDLVESLQSPRPVLHESRAIAPSDYRQQLIEWVWQVEKRLNLHEESVESVFGMSAMDLVKTEFLRNLNESELSVDQLAQQLIDTCNLRFDEPSVDATIDVYQFQIIPAGQRFEYRINRNAQVEESRHHMAMTDQGLFAFDTSLFAGHLTGWTPAANRKGLTMMLLASDLHDGQSYFHGWRFNDGSDSLQHRLPHLFKKIVEDAEPTPDGVNPTTCMFLNERDVPSRASVIREFFKFCCDYLELRDPPRIRLKRDPAWSARNHTFGRYNPGNNSMELALTGRNIMDICRTLGHELVHAQQNERGLLHAGAGEDGSECENEANSVAGVIMRQWGKLHPEFFEPDAVNEASGYIPTKSQARDPRFSMALTQDVRPGETGRQANKLGLITDTQGRPQTARADGRIERQLTEALAAFKSKRRFTQDDFARNIFESFADYRRWTRQSKTSTRGQARYFAEKYQGLFITESDHSDFNQRKSQSREFIQFFKSLDSRQAVTIEEGDSIAILSSTAVPMSGFTQDGVDVPSRIELDGFITPKKITSIILNADDQIDTIEFADGTQWPESAELTTIANTSMYTVNMYPNKESAQFALKRLMPKINQLKAKGWIAEIRVEGLNEQKDSIEEGAAADSYLWQARVKITQKQGGKTSYTGYIPVTVSAPDMRRARILIAQMYGVADKDIGSTTRMKRK